MLFPRPAQMQFMLVLVAAACVVLYLESRLHCLYILSRACMWGSMLALTHGALRRTPEELSIIRR